MTSPFLARVQVLADKAGLQTAKPGVAMLPTGQDEGLVVYGRPTRRERGDEFQFLVFNGEGLVSVHLEQGNYAGGTLWQMRSGQPVPRLQTDLQSLINALPAPQQLPRGSFFTALQALISSVRRYLS